MCVGIPHRLSHDDTYNGMDLPKGSLVIPNIWCVVCDTFSSAVQFYRIIAGTCFTTRRFIPTQWILTPTGTRTTQKWKRLPTSFSDSGEGHVQARRLQTAPSLQSRPQYWPRVRSCSPSMFKGTKLFKMLPTHLELSGECGARMVGAVVLGTERLSTVSRLRLIAT